MSNITFTNFAATTLNTGINSSVTSLVVSSGTGALFPSLVGSQYFYCTLVDAATGTTREIVKVTARSTDTFTIVRGQESTSSSSYLAGDKVELRLTAAGINTFATTETAQTFVGNQTISGTLTATTIGAFTLSGTVSGGGNQLNNVIIGTTTPLAGAFTTLSATGLITGRSTNGQVFAATNSSNSSFSLDISSAKVTFSQLASAGTLDTIIDSTIRTSISSTGLAVTGTLSSTSTISSTKISGAWIQNVSATTGAAYYAQTNTAGSLYLGVESSTGGSIMSGTTAYASVFGTDNNKPVQIVSNNAVVGSFSSTGLAVTGDISLPTTNQLGWGASPYTCAIEGASGASGYIRLFTNNAERARIDSSGNLLVGDTSLVGSGKISITFSQSSNQGVALKNSSAGNAANYILFLNSADAQSGIIAQTGATSVVYTTTSDYRLKKNQEPLTNSGNFIDALKPKTWEWVADGSKASGFIAHEFSEISPLSVFGEKDATREEEYEISPAIPATQDEEGNEITAAVEAVKGNRTVPVYQGMQASSSEVIANMVAELQSLRKRITALEAK